MDLVIGYTVVITKVLVGLGFVIFVHELGHFVVAKLCGVKCEKFYLGFDIAGLKFCKFRWGETEYGIGILPLGGYVKMLGQEDNPAKLREEMERAKQQGREERGEGRMKEGWALQCPVKRQIAISNQQSTINIQQSAIPLRPTQLPGQERAEAHGDHFGRRHYELDLRFPNVGGSVQNRNGRAACGRG